MGLLSGENTLLYNCSNTEGLNDHDKNKDNPIPNCFPYPHSIFLLGKMTTYSLNISTVHVENCTVMMGIV